MPDAVDHVLADAKQHKGVGAGEQRAACRGWILQSIEALLEPSGPNSEGLMTCEGRLSRQQRHSLSGDRSGCAKRKV